MDDYNWDGMPEFNQSKISPNFKGVVAFMDSSAEIHIRIEKADDFILFSERVKNFNRGTFLVKSREDLSLLSNQKITDKTKSIWFPFKPHCGGVKYKYISEYPVIPKFPVYIVSKGRADNGLTTKTLNDMGVPHYIVVEIHEAAEYKAKTNAEILVLPSKYLNNYDTCDELGNTKSKGPGASRNYCIDHSLANGFGSHWVMDDNIDAFHYLNKNEKYEVETGATLLAAEDFINRYENIPVAGFNYYSFCKKTDKVPPYVLNTRIYSCLFIDNYSGYRWRGRYNEDTDLSLRVLKDGLCTLQFNAFLCGKVTTQRMKGGNTKEFYSEEGTLNKSQMLEDLHPDVAKVVWKFNRWHHWVDYKPFKKNKLILKDKDKDGFIVNNYGLKKISI